MNLSDLLEDFDASFLQNSAIAIRERPVSEERKALVGEEVDAQSVVRSEAEKDLMNPEIPGVDTVNTLYSTESSISAMDSEETEAVNFIYQNSEPQTIWERIKDKTHEYMVVQETVDLAIADLASGYSTAERVQDFITGLIPFETIEDNLDMVDSIFKGDNLGKLHRKFWSGDEATKAAVVQYISGMSEYMEKDKILTMLSLLRDPNGEEELDSFWGVNGGAWAGLELLDLTPVGLAALPLKAGESALKTAKAVKQLEKINKMIKDKIVSERVVDKLAPVNPQKAKQVLSQIASGNTASKTMSQTEAVLKLDPTAPDGMYKAGATLTLYDETVSVADKASWLVDQIIGNKYILRETLFDDELLAKVAREPLETLEKTRAQLLEILQDPQVKMYGFSEIDKAIGPRLKVIFGEDRYNVLKSSLNDGSDINLSRTFLSRMARDADVRLISQEEISPTQVKFTYEMRTTAGSGRGTEAQIVVKEEIFTRDSVTNALGEQNIGLVKEALSSPVAKYSGNAREIAKEMQRVENVDSKLSGSFRVLFAEALKPIGKTFVLPSAKKSLKKLSTALEKLDDIDTVMLKRVPTRQEMLEGIVQLADGSMMDLQFRLTEKEADAFFNMRAVLDQLSRLGDAEEIRRMVAKGYVGVSNNSLAQGGAARVIDSSVDSGKVKAALQGKKVFVPHKNINGLLKLTDEEIDDLVENGYKLVEFQDSKVAGNGKDKYTLAFVPPTDIEDLASYAVKTRGYKTNYLPRVYDSAYWVKQEIDEVVNGLPMKRQVAVMQTNSKVEADEFIKSQKNPDRFQVLMDREAQDAGLHTGGVRADGNSMLFSRGRAAQTVKYGKDLVEPTRVGAFDALSRYLNNLSGFVARNEMRLRVEQQWLNEVKKIKGSTAETFSSASIPTNHPRFNELMNLKSQIEQWMRLPTVEEQWWSRKMQATYEWALGAEKSGNMITKSLASSIVAPFSQWAKNGDPLGFIRNVNFNMYLGVFNPVQMLVQAQQSAITFALHPKKWVGATQKQFMLATLDAAARGGSLSKKMYPHIRKVFGVKMTDEQIEQLWNAWNKSGLFESAVNTADYAAITSGKQITGALLTRMLEKGQLFYRMGVLSEKRVNFIVAYDEWLEKSGGKLLDDAALRGIVKRAREYSFEMDKANRANFQKGLISIPTQFYQIFAKTVENMLPAVGGKGSGNFTRAEATRIFLGVAALYGAAGTPITAALMRVYNSTVKEEGGVEQEDPNIATESAEAFVKNGLIGMATMWVSALAGDGQQFNVGERFSPLAGMDRVLDEALFEKGFATTMLGASGGILERLSDTWKVLKNVSTVALDSHEFPSVADYVRTLESALSIASTFRNSSKAFKSWYFDEVRSTAGVLLQSDATAFEALMMSLGITSSDLMKVYHVDDIRRFQQERFRSYVKEMRKIFLFYTQNYDITTGSKREEMTARMAAILKSVPSEIKKTELMQAVWNDSIGMSKEEKQYFDGLRSGFKNEIEMGVLGALSNVQLGIGE